MKLALGRFVIALAIVASLYISLTPAKAEVLSALSLGISPPIFQQNSTKSVPVGNVQVDLYDTTKTGLAFRQSLDRSGSSLGRLYNDAGVVLRFFGNEVTANGKKAGYLVAVIGDLNIDLKPKKVKGIYEFPDSSLIFDLSLGYGGRRSLDIAIDRLQPGSYQVAFYAFDPKGIRQEKKVDLSWLTLGLVPMPIITSVKHKPATDLVDIIQFSIVEKPIPPVVPDPIPDPPTNKQTPEEIVPDTPDPAVLNPPTIPSVKIEESLAVLVENDAKLAAGINELGSKIVQLEAAFQPTTPTTFSFSVAFVRNYRGWIIVDSAAGLGLDVVNDVTLNCLQSDGTWQPRVMWEPVSEQYRSVFLLPGYEAYKKRIGIARYAGIKEPFKVGYKTPESDVWQYVTITPKQQIQGKILVVPVEGGAL